MTKDEIRSMKALLHRGFQLGFEAGVNKQNCNEIEESWDRMKYFFALEFERYENENVKGGDACVDRSS